MDKECKECELLGMCKLLLSKSQIFPTTNCKIMIKMAIKEMEEE